MNGRTYILMMLVFTGVTIPYISLPGVLTADPKERLSANGYRLFFAKGAALMVTTFVPLFAAKWGPDHIARGYQVSMAVMAVIATLLFLLCFFTTTERVQHTIERKPLGEQLSLLSKNASWYDKPSGICLPRLGLLVRQSFPAMADKKTPADAGAPSGCVRGANFHASECEAPRVMKVRSFTLTARPSDCLES